MVSMKGLNSVWGLNESKYDEIDELPLMSTIGPLIIILVGYLVFVLKLGPDFMKKREAFNLKTILIVYNALQVVASAYLVQMFFRGLLKTGLIPKYCPMYDEILRKEVLIGIYTYLAVKLTELLDTVFFVLRKKDKQVTFLHLYHHTFALTISWLLLKYWPSHNVFFMGFLNALVHVFMYTYYGLAAWRPDFSNILKWKKYITKLQLIQFVSVIIQYVASVTVSDCPPTIAVASLLTGHAIFFLVMFLKFYRQTYNKKK